MSACETTSLCSILSLVKLNYIIPTKEGVYLAGYYINTIEKLIRGQEFPEEFHKISSMSHVALSALRDLMIVKTMINDETQSLDQFFCEECNKIYDYLMKSMTTTFHKI